MIKRFNILRSPEPEPAGGGNPTPPVAPVETPPVAPVETPPVVVPPVGTSPALLNEDGTFSADWHKRPEFAELKGIERFKSPAEMAKAYRELETKMSKGESINPAAKPAADAPPEAVKAWREAQGIPVEPDGYTLKPESLPEGAVWNEAAGKHFAGVFHKLDLPGPVAAEISKAFTEFEADQARQLETAYDNKIAADTAALKTEWGGETAYQTKVGEIKTLVASLGGDINDTLTFSNPNVVRFLGKVVGSLSPDSIAKLPGVVAQGGGFRQPQEEAKAIMTDPNHPDHARYKDGDVDTIRKVSRLSGGG